MKRLLLVGCILLGVLYVSAQNGGKARSFTSSNHSLTISNHPDIAIGNGFTIEMWLWTGSDVNTHQLVLKKGVAHGYELLISSGKLLFGTQGSRINSAYYAMTDPFLAPNRWYHVGIFFNGTSWMLVHVNGELLGSKNFNGSTYSTNSSDLVFGGSAFKGYLDEIRFWRYDLGNGDLEDWRHREVNANHPYWSDLSFSFGYMLPLINEAGFNQC